MSIRWENNLNLSGLLHAVEEATPEALAEGMEHIRAAAVELTPVESGRLAGSATVEVRGDEASITFDGPYARYQHERLDLHHEHGQAKYLEQPLHTEAQTVIDIVAKRIERAL